MPMPMLVCLFSSSFSPCSSWFSGSAQASHRWVAVVFCEEKVLGLEVPVCNAVVVAELHACKELLKVSACHGLRAALIQLDPIEQLPPVRQLKYDVEAASVILYLLADVQ